METVENSPSSLLAEEMDIVQYSRPRLSVVIPVYNERGTIAELLRRVQAVQIKKEIIIVDDGSTDGSREFLSQFNNGRQFFRELCSMNAPDIENRAMIFDSNESHNEDVRFLFQESNAGKGSALRRGFAEAQGQTIIVQDADLELDPEDYHKLLAPIEAGTADVVYGSRFSAQAAPQTASWHILGNRFLTTFSNVFTGLALTDVWTCYKAFRRTALGKIQIKENRFGVEPELTAKIARGRWRVHEVSISYQSRSYAEGKKIGWRDGIRALWCVVRYQLFD